MPIRVLAALGSLSACAVAAAGCALVPRAERRVDEPVDLGLLQMELHSNQSEAQEQTATEIINAYNCQAGKVCHTRHRGVDFCNRASWCSTLDAVKEWCDSKSWCKGFWWHGREVYPCQSTQWSYGGSSHKDRLCMKGDPTPRPTTSPTPRPTGAPTTLPTPTPTGSPTAQPTPGPTPSPTPNPTSSPTVVPSASPTPSPTPGPSASPTSSPSSAPTAAPTPSPTASPTVAPSASPTPSPTPGPSASPTSSPASSPSSAPTAAPTPGRTPSTETDQATAALDGKGKSAFDLTQGPSAPTSEGSAVGDPHLVNLHGQRFDLLRAGEHTLVKIPRGAADAASKLLVWAEAQQLGGDCMDMYFKTVNVTGDWVDTTLSGQGSTRGSGIEYWATRSSPASSGWQKFGPVELKVVHGRTRSGIDYLNFFARRLAEAGYPVGGLLGEDDHSAVSTPSSRCMHTIDLHGDARAAREGSTAEAA